MTPSCESTDLKLFSDLVKRIYYYGKLGEECLRLHRTCPRNRNDYDLWVTLDYWIFWSTLPRVWNPGWLKALSEIWRDINRRGSTTREDHHRYFIGTYTQTLIYFRFSFLLMFVYRRRMFKLNMFTVGY